MPLPRSQKMFWLSVLGFSSITYLVVALARFSPAVVPIFPPPDTEDTSLCSSLLATSPSQDTVYFITPTYPRREQVKDSFLTTYLLVSFQPCSLFLAPAFAALFCLPDEVQSTS